MKKLSFVVALLLAAGCGSDSTAPRADLAGSWTYSATNLSVSGVTCSITGVSLTLVTTGNTFTGTVAPGGVLICAGPAGADTASLGGDVVANGTVNGNAVAFDIGTQDFHNAGTLSGNSMSGNVTVHSVDNGISITLTGNFSAVKH